MNFNPGGTYSTRLPRYDHVFPPAPLDEKSGEGDRGNVMYVSRGYLIYGYEGSLGGRKSYGFRRMTRRPPIC